jgi:hypothetical protein
MRTIKIVILAMIITSGVFGMNRVQSEEEHPAAEPDTTELAKQTQNPVADLISIPFQFNFNNGGGLEDGTLMILNWQPVIPFKLNDDWNMIARTIVPVVSIPGPDDLHFSGIADIQEQIFISPSKASKLIWGVGPILSLPTATATPVQTGSWAAGPTFVALTMSGPWVLGGLINNVWTFSDSGSSTEVNQFFLQPFVNYNFGKGWAITTGPAITANWDAPSGQQWTVPLGFGISRTTVFAGRPISIAAQYYHNVEHPDNAAANQIRLQVALLYPKR